jgi:hypothetical protein
MKVGEGGVNIISIMVVARNNELKFLKLLGHRPI